jgi:hypothetical protein
MPRVKTVNLKRDMPTLEEARVRLAEALRAARREGCAALKVVHGYGSSGTGGTLRHGIQASLRKRRKKGEIAAFIPGDKWSIFEASAREWIERVPELARDGDLDRGNEGVSLVFL